MKKLFLLLLLSAAPAFAQTVHEVDLSWKAPVPNGDPVVGYDVFRMQSGLSFTQVNTSTVSSLAFKDVGVSANTSYQYYVVSVDGNGVQSGPSNVVLVTTPADLAFPFNFIGTLK